MKRATAALVLVLSCGPRDGIIGHAGAGGRASDGGLGGVPASVDAGDEQSIFLAEFEPGTSGWEEQVVVPGATTASGIPDDAARDGYVATLVFPGHAEYSSAERAEAGDATQIESLGRFSFGSYRARVAFGSCADDEEVVSAFLGYFSDGVDHDFDGITDDLEVDLQITCSNPAFAYLTVFTDYEDTPRGPVFQKLGRVVDFANGDLYDTPADDSDRFELSGNEPGLVQPELFAPGVFREIGFDWQPDTIRFVVGVDGTDHELWQLSGQSHIPQVPLNLTFNLWHPSEHWFPREGSADYPTNDVALSVDWVTVSAERTSE
jgi:hypothetical protein